MEFSKPFDSYKILPEVNGVITTDRCEAVIFKYATGTNDHIDIKIGISYISCEQARINLNSEIKGWDFELVKSTACNVWNDALDKIRVEGGSEKERVIFYTALYRSLLRTCNITEDGRYFSGFDGKIHESHGNDFYVNDGTWDTYRSQHPLQILLEPERQNEIVCSYIRMYEQSGWLPRFPYHEGDRPVMIGNHAASFITDAYFKGIKDFDLELAYQAMKKNSLEATWLPWRNGPATQLDQVYLEKGYFPALAKNQMEWVPEVHPFEKRQAVSVTLDHAYDDWCIAQTAKALNRDEDYNYFIKRAYNYRNLYNEETGFISPRTADGSWVEDFDPKFGGGQGGRDYFAECNSWIFSFHVQHDVQGLIDLAGGRKKFEERLDSLFIEQYDHPNYEAPKYDFLKQFPDATGLIGQYCQGNEPAFHIPYLYNYTGAPWKTQRKVREIMKIWYDDGPQGICGDEDGGAMSSWYVFSAMGFYPVCPGSPTYNIGSPIFNEAVINVGNGKVFVIKAQNVSSRNKYIQSAVLNGKPLDKPWFRHSDIVAGGMLTLYMGDRPNREWGSRPEAAPPSMSAGAGESI
jgi:predicted alpha-1,2-mannosidase